MAHANATDIVLGWYHGSPLRRSGRISDNPLARMLYHAYCRRNGIDGTFDDVIRSGSYSQAAATLFAWYSRRYGDGFQMPRGTQGKKRTVPFHTTDYTFDLLYCDDRQFQNYLANGIPQSGTADLFSFILHTAVAFLVPPGELDTVLQQLGFHPLHVKNIHHLAVYYVLLEAENREMPDTFNPFAQVRALYFQALEIMDSPSLPAGEGYDYADLETRMIREALFLGKALNREKFDNLILINKDAMNMRHSCILADFHKLSAVFMNLYDSLPAKKDDAGNSEQAVPALWHLPEEAYCFQRFVDLFCREDLSRKKYREQLTGMIDRNRKHPTRNVVILLWLYAHCFRFLPGVFVERSTCRKIARQLSPTHPDWAAAVKTYCCGSDFDVFGFLTDTPCRATGEVFSGAEFITDINEKLLLRYGWGPLNARLPFDYYIQCLEKLVVIPPAGDASGGRVLYDGRPIPEPIPAVDNVPYPLAVITWLLTRLKEATADSTGQPRTGPMSPLPLKCSLYEQV